MTAATLDHETNGARLQLRRADHNAGHAHQRRQMTRLWLARGAQTTNEQTKLSKNKQTNKQNKQKKLKHTHIEISNGQSVAVRVEQHLNAVHFDRVGCVAIELRRGACRRRFKLQVNKTKTRAKWNF